MKRGKLTSASVYAVFLPLSGLTGTALADNPASQPQLNSETVDVGAVRQLVIDQLAGPVRQQQKQSGWSELQIRYDTWLPDSVGRLPVCLQPLTIKMAGRLRSLWGRQSFRIECPDAHGWVARAQLTVTASLPVWLAAQTLRKDQAITPADVRLERVTLNNLHQGFSVKTDDLTGFRSQRLISAGQVIDPAVLLPPLLVHRGDQVVIQAQQDGFHASMQGEALEDGVAGKLIRIRNLSSGKEIQAEVSTKGVVLVRF